MAVSRGRFCHGSQVGRQWWAIGFRGSAAVRNFNAGFRLVLSHQRPLRHDAVLTSALYAALIVLLNGIQANIVHCDAQGLGGITERAGATARIQIVKRQLLKMFYPINREQHFEDAVSIVRFLKGSEPQKYYDFSHSLNARTYAT